MSAAAIPYPLDPAFVGEPWTHDFIFCLDEPCVPEPWAGSEVTITLVRRGILNSSATLSTDAGTLFPPDDCGVLAVKAPWAALELLPGNYDGEIRRVRPDGIAEVAATFVLPVQI